MTDNKKDKQQTKMTDEELNQLSIKIVSRMMNIFYQVEILETNNS